MTLAAVANSCSRWAVDPSATFNVTKTSKGSSFDGLIHAENFSNLPCFGVSREVNLETSGVPRFDQASASFYLTPRRKTQRSTALFTVAFLKLKGTPSISMSTDPSVARRCRAPHISMGFERLAAKRPMTLASATSELAICCTVHGPNVSRCVRAF